MHHDPAGAHRANGGTPGRVLPRVQGRTMTGDMAAVVLVVVSALVLAAYLILREHQ